MKSLHCILLNFALLMAASRAMGQDDFQQVGVAPDGQVAFEYIGLVKQDGFNFTTFGYFTYIRNVPDQMLFFESDQRDHHNARFTFHGKSKMINRSIVNKMFSLGVKGELVVYVRQESASEASLDNPADFTLGKPIATMETRGQSIVAVTAPNVGINSATLEMKQTQKDWKGFRDGEKKYSFGRPTSLFRLSHIGNGERSQEEPLIATITIAGHAVSVAESED